jgi:hypothetical protein
MAATRGGHCGRRSAPSSARARLTKRAPAAPVPPVEPTDLESLHHDCQPSSFGLPITVLTSAAGSVCLFGSCLMR